MTDDQLYVPFRNEQRLLTNSHECTSQNAEFDLGTYGPYLDKIRELFVPSLEYRIYSLLEEFVYSEDSRWAVQFPYFKKFVDMIATWKGPLIKAAEYDIGTMEKAIRSTVKRVVKDDLVTSFLDSITLHYRLNKICRELDALGIEDNILRSLNVWDFVNERKNHRFTIPATDYNANSSDAKEPARCKKAIELMTDEAYRERNVEPPTTSESTQIVDSSLDFHRWDTEDDSTRIESVNEEPRDAESTKNPRNSDKKLKMIVRKMYPEDCGHRTLSRSIVTCLTLPCEPSDLLGRIFEIDPSLTESCFIVMKRKFLTSVYNVCSCLNDILGKLDVKFTRTLYLNCEIYPGYIRFRLKSDNVNKCLLVARIPICQSVRRRAIQRNSAISTCCESKLSTDARELKRFEQCNEDNNTREESEQLDDTCCSRSDRNTKDTMNISGHEPGNEEATTCTITECDANCLQDLTSCYKSRENIAEEIHDVTSHVDNSEERNGECHKILNSVEIDRGSDAEERRWETFNSDNSITMTNEKFRRLIDDTNCVCSLADNFVETHHETENNFSDKAPDKEPNLADEDCNANTCSIASFVQNSGRDKQLVELNCNRFLDNDIGAIDGRSGDDAGLSLNSAKAEIGRDSSRADERDFIDIKVDNILGASCAFEVSGDESSNANHYKLMKLSSENNDSLTVSVQTPRLRVSSKGIGVNMSYPRAVVWLASGDDGSTSTKTRDRREPSVRMGPWKGHKNLRRVFGQTRGFIKSSRRSSVSRSWLRSNDDSKNSDISTEECLRATSNTSRCCCSTSKFSASDRRDKFEKIHKSARLSRLCVSSSSGFRSVTSFTTKYGTASRKDNDFSAKVRPQAILVMTKFRDSVDRSVGRIKRLIHAKLRKILFNDGTKTTKSSKSFRKNEESSEDTTREKISGRCVRQGYSITSCSTCNFCRRSCAVSSRESSDVILSIRRNRCIREESKSGMKFHDRKLTGGSETLSTFRLIETSFNSLTSTVEDLEEHDMSRSDRRRERIERNRNYGIAISSKVTANNSKYLERYITCKQREETRDDKRVYEGIRNQDRWKEMRRGRTCREVPIKYSSNESVGSSSSYSRRGRARGVHKRSESGGSRAKTTRGFAPSGKNPQKDADRLHKKRALEDLVDTYNNYADDLDLEIKLHLLRYVELCRNIKRALMRTLQPDEDFYEIDTLSNARWRPAGEFD